MNERRMEHPADQPSRPSRPPVERAEELLNRIGERVGSSAASVSRRVRQTGTAAAAPKQPELERADAAVRRAEETIAAYATVIGRRLRRLAARAREEAEDIRAEAQHFRTERQQRAATPAGGEEAEPHDRSVRRHVAREPERESRTP